MTMPKPSSKDRRPARGFTRAMRDLEREHMLTTYLRGIVYGLGALTAVAIVMPLMVWILQKIEWVPVIGDFVTRVLYRVEMRSR